MAAAACAAWWAGTGVWIAWALAAVVLELRAVIEHRSETPTLSHVIRAYERHRPWVRVLVGGGLVVLFLHWVVELF